MKTTEAQRRARKRYAQTHKEAERQKSREHYYAHKEEYKRKHRLYVLAHKQEIIEYRKKWYGEHKEEQNKKRRKYQRDMKVEVLTHYSESPPRCAHCEESDLDVLCIDHIYGGGTNHRRTLEIKNFYTWLIRNNYPDGYQVLCANCNLRKRIKNKEHYRGKNG